MELTYFLESKDIYSDQLECSFYLQFWWNWNFFSRLDQNGTDSISDSIRLGEITPFDALAQQQKKVTIPKLIAPSKAKKQKIEKTFTYNPRKDDNDYVPVDNESDEQLDEDSDTENKTKKKKSIGKKRKSKVNENSKYLREKKAKPKKTMDDGSFKCFKERMQ